jgi:Gluconate 2-dehydrogenase subunit 3
VNKRVSKREAGRHAPVTPGNKGRFGDYDVLGEVSRWDLVTSGVVLARLDTDPQLSFFTAEEEPTVRALVDLLLAQHEEPRVPVTELIDQRLTAGLTDGWHYEDMPEDGDAWRQSLAGLDEEATDTFGERFHRLSLQQQGSLVQAVQDADEWHGFKVTRLWSLWTRYSSTAFYSHPWAWNEIGFGGPAYPRGYKNLGIDARERWEYPDLDASDPVPWAHRRESAERAHEQGLGGRPNGKDSDSDGPIQASTLIHPEKDDG